MHIAVAEVIGEDVNNIGLRERLGSRQASVRH
jgi:hypothetical protein